MCHFVFLQMQGVSYSSYSLHRAKHSGPKLNKKIRWFRDTSHGELDRRRFHKGQEQNKHISMPMSAFEFLTALNIFLSITVSLGNALILIALHVETSLHPPTKLLFRCLAITDLCVGVISQPLFAVLFSSYAATGMSSKALLYINKLNITSSLLLCGVSVLTSTAISVDRLQGLFSGLRHRHVVTLPRVRAAITCFWIIGITNASIYLWNIDIAVTVFFALIILSLIASAFSYAKIYIKLRQHQLQKHAVVTGRTELLL